MGDARVPPEAGDHTEQFGRRERRPSLFTARCGGEVEVLEPEKDVERRAGVFHALSDDPWLALVAPDLRRLAGRFVELTYRSSFWDEPARPVFRFWTRDGRAIDRIATGPIFGAGVWIGRAPPDVARIGVSPTNRPGPFGFVIERARPRSWSALVAEGWRRQKRPARSAVLTRLIGWTPESDVNLTWAIAAEPVGDDPAWRRRRERPLDLAALDRPRFDWSTAPPIRVFIRASRDEAALRRTLASLKAQVFPSWIAIVTDRETPSSDPRVRHGAAAAAGHVAHHDALTTLLAAGDTLEPGALAIVAEQAHRHPSRRLFYGDEHRIDETGARTPVFRPAWDRGLMPGCLSGHGSFVRGFDDWDAPERRKYLDAGLFPPGVLAGLGRGDVLALHRMILTTSRSPAHAAAIFPAAAPTIARAAIVIPTRDHPALLRRIVASIRARTRPGSYTIVVIDNGSVTEDAKALLAELEGQPDVTRIDRPGPFNFSAMCNEAAAASSGDVLLFLNDDMEVLSDGWLDRLSSLASQPSVGAVGARLTYPDGRLQHVGVVVGMGESAGHFGALAAGDDPGWADRNRVVHEVTAVTGACLAVERRKFEAVGGFDAVHLPIELSDIDLCLKLNARGWQTMIDPAVRLMHEESVSRGGATLRRLDVYGGQRAIFVERWRHVLRDDPAFHPGLSLYSTRVALG